MSGGKEKQLPGSGRAAGADVEDLSSVPLESYPTAETNDSGAYLALPETNLSDTFGAFNSRIQKRKKQVEVADTESARLTKARHAFILEAMMSIRRSLSDVVRIELGERFSLILDADDWQGWPRLIILLSDSEDPEATYPFFEVTANDRHSRASIEIFYGEPRITDTISLAQASDLRRMPTILRKCVRAFLDQIGTIVIEAERVAEELKDGKIESKKVSTFEEQHKEDSSLTGDLFCDDFNAPDVFDSLPTVDAVDCLPDSSD